LTGFGKLEDVKVVKKIFEVKENRVSVINVVLAVLSLVSIFTSYIIIKVIWGFEVTLKGPGDAALVLLDIVVALGSPICIIIRNLKLKSTPMFIWHTVLEYIIGFAVALILIVGYALIAKGSGLV